LVGLDRRVADDGTFVAVARFANPQAAMNSDRRAAPVVMETSLFAGDVVAHDCANRAASETGVAPTMPGSQ
jgi:hypothetical protein